MARTSPGPDRGFAVPLARVTALAAAASIATTATLASAQQPPPTAAPTAQAPTQPPPTGQSSTQPPPTAAPTGQPAAQPPPTAAAPGSSQAPPPGSAPPAGSPPPSGYGQYPPPGAYPYPYPPGAYPYPPGAYPYPYPPGFYPPGFSPPAGEPLPPTLPYQEGRAIPPGYHLEHHVQRRLAIPGVAILGGMWLGSVVAAAAMIGSRDTAPLFFPVVGPFITIHTADMNINNGEPVPMLALIIDGVAQTTGAALLLAGLLAKQPVLVLDKGQKPATSDSRSPTLDAFRPAVSVGPGSVSLTWQL